MKTISARNVTKEFRLTGKRYRYKTLSEMLSPRRLKSLSRKTTRYVALENISFDAHAGEVIGILGRNGAGKSTLLKILGRIIRPTKGRIELQGRVGSLLEVGSGFHPELTGRENIFLNGAILGMRRSEIKRKLDEIIEFAGVGQHLDEPVKHYSSGMYMRLAFSVAAHIEPEILLVDEVLAVGDAEFQKKCLKRIEQVGQSGQTVMFVSHSTETILRLCNRALLIDKGKLVAAGSVHDVTATYLQMKEPNQGECYFDGSPSYPGDDVARLLSLRVRSRGGATLTIVDVGQEFGIEMEFQVRAGSAALFPVVGVYNQYGTQVLWATDVGTEWHGRPRPSGRYRVVVWIPPHLLAAGPMSITPAMYSLGPRVKHFSEPDAVGFQIAESSNDEGARGRFTEPVDAATMPKLRWDVDYRCEPAEASWDRILSNS